MKEREYWIDYLRSFIILTVVIHHASLAYTTFAHFNKEPYILSTHPIVDTRRWIGFDTLVYFNDIFFIKAGPQAGICDSGVPGCCVGNIS